MYFLKIILSLSGAVMLATLPGFLDVNYSLGGFSVRAAGGAAAFVFIYTQSPHLPVLKADPTITRPATQQERPVSRDGHGPHSVDGFPVMMAFSIMPQTMLPPAAIWTENAIHVESGSPGLGVTLPAASGALTGGISIMQAVSADAVAVVAAVIEYARKAVRSLKMLLDTAASALRGGVSSLADAVGGLFSGLRASLAEPQKTLAVITEDLSARTGALIDGLLGPGATPVTDLLVNVNHVTTSLIGGVQTTVDDVVGVTDRVVHSLTGTVQDTTHRLLDGTGELTHGVTGLLDKATGGLTSGVTPAVDRLVDGVTGTAGHVVDRLTPALQNGASQVLHGVGDSVGHITNSLNAVTPGLISKLDPDFAVSHDLLDLPATLQTAAPLPALDQLTGPLAGIGGDGQRGLIGGLADNPLLTKSFADPLGGKGLGAGPVCIGGCGGEGLLPKVGSGLRNTVGGLGLNGPLVGGGRGLGLGGASGGGPGGGGLAAGPGGGGHSVGGAVSSTLGNVRSGVGRVTGALGRRK